VVSLDLADDRNGWLDLRVAIYSAGKYVALNLSACTMGRNAQGVIEFDPEMDNIGKGRIVSLVLPNSAQSIKASTSSSPAFRYFTSLNSVTGANIMNIGDYTFDRCKTLTTMNFPKATSIGNGAFFGCTALTTVSLPAAISIRATAFTGCSALSTVNLPKATSISDYAFAVCTALTTLNLSSVPPILGSNVFYETYSSDAPSATLTIRVPAGKVSAYTTK
jgi:hypothetical protein